MHIDTSITINRPADEVFAVLADYRRDSQWRPAVMRISVDPDAPVTVGSRIEEELHFAGRRWLTPTVVTDLQPGRSLTFEGGSSSSAIRGRREVVPAGPGKTTVRQRLDITLHGPLRFILEPLLARSYRRVAADDLDRLRALLETGPASPATTPAGDRPRAVSA